MSNVIPFPKKHRDGARVPAHVIRNRRCLVCERYGCFPRFVTPESAGGRPTGDNVMPLCPDHALFPMSRLIHMSQRVTQWLYDHDRLDILLDLGVIRG